jgi:hypothetical protein
MRITRETLIRIAKETAQKRALSDRGLVAAYLTGSLLGEEPFLGSTTDIDIIFVHAGEPQVRREILAVTADVHLDLIHNSRSEYDKPKELRVHPWLGPDLYDPMPLYVTQHFFEFVQAGVRDKFHEPVNVLARARRNAEHARQIWSGLQIAPPAGPELLLDYLRAVNHAANAVAILGGTPLAERRFLLQFPSRAEAAGRPGMAAGLLGLLGGGRLDAAVLNGLLPEWEKAFQDAAGRPRVDARIATARLGYYRQAFELLLAGDSPQAILWPLLLTWTLSAAVLPPTHQSRWLAACEQAGLAGAALQERVDALDAFIDTVEEILDNFATGNNL